MQKKNKKWDGVERNSGKNRQKIGEKLKCSSNGQKCPKRSRSVIALKEIHEKKGKKLKCSPNGQKCPKHSRSMIALKEIHDITN